MAHLIAKTIRAVTGFVMVGAVLFCDRDMVRQSALCFSIEIVPSNRTPTKLMVPGVS